MLGDVLFPPADQRRTTLSLLSWWESRRLTFNAAVGANINAFTDPELTSSTVLAYCWSEVPSLGNRKRRATISAATSNTDISWATL